MSSKAFEPVGSSVEFYTGFLAEITDMSLDVSVDDIDVSHFASEGYKDYISTKLKEPGELNCTINFDPSVEPPVGGTPETITINFSDSASSSWSADGYMKSISVSGSVGEQMSAECVLKFTGPINYSA